MCRRSEPETLAARACLLKDTGMSTHSAASRGCFWPVAGRLALLVALVAAAYAHRAHAHPGGLSPLAMAQYVLPDGSLPDLCFGGSDGGQPGHHCEFCLIAGAAAPPPPVAGTGVRSGAVCDAPVIAGRGIPAPCPACLATSPLRGPPDRPAA